MQTTVKKEGAKHAILMAFLAFGLMTLIGIGVSQLALPPLTATTALSIVAGVIGGTFLMAYVHFRLLWLALVASGLGTGITAMAYAIQSIAISTSLVLTEFAGIFLTVLAYKYLAMKGSREKTI